MMLRSAQGTDAETLFDQIQSECFAAMEKLGQAEADAWQERISVDVEYVTGPRGGVHVIRSQPGEPPRRETGKLWESIGNWTEADGFVITTVIGSDVEYAFYLEHGTFEIFPRPMQPDPDELHQRFNDTIADVIAARG